MERRLTEFFNKKIAAKAGFEFLKGKVDPIITGLQYDSRKVEAGNLFFALPGLHTDGSLYIEEAIKRGAAAVVYEKAEIKPNPKILFIKVKNARFAMSPIADAFFNFPSRRIPVVGITGTEGKSTTVFLTWQLLTLMGKKAGFISTVNSCTGGEIKWNSEHQTTPEAPVIHKLLSEMIDNGCEYAVLESSSHGLSQKTNRLGNVNYCCSVLTNLTHEHLEFHGTWERYRSDKANLFRALDRYVPIKSKTFTSKPFCIINADDKSAEYFAEAAKCKKYYFSCEGKNADIITNFVESSAYGNWYRLFIKDADEHIEIRDKLPGAFNMGNVMAALLVVSGLLNLPVREIAPFVKELKPVHGRMTTINKGQPFELVVDYAHTPSSFEAVFPPLRTRLDKTGKKIISLFGSAGERDTQKRPEQGKIASLYSDYIILTDEDPRGENSMDILEEIMAGIETQDTFITQDTDGQQTRVHFKRDKNLFLIPNRRDAIRKALSLAESEDLVLLLGKGHENSIIYNDHVMPFDEIAEAEKALAERGYS